MLNTKSTNYDKFTCIADKCPCSCCKGWEIVIDEDKLSEYADYIKKDETCSIAARLYNGINWEEGTFKQYDGRCALLGDSEYCDLQLEAGEDKLCKTCRLYPRHVEEFEDVREWSLSLSCPEAARIILSNKEKLEFIEWETDEEELYDEYEDFDYFLYSELIGVRELAYKIIQNRKLSFEEKASSLVKLGIIVQELVDDDRVCDIESVLSSFECDKEHDSYREKRLFSKLYELEMLSDDWNEVIDKTWNNWTDNLVLTDGEQIQAEQLLMFWVYTYLCGAVYDDCILSKMMLAVCSVYWIFQIAHTGGCQKLCDGSDGDERLITAAYSFAREIEHSDENLNALEEWFFD